MSDSAASTGTSDFMIRSLYGTVALFGGCGDSLMDGCCDRSRGLHFAAAGRDGHYAAVCAAIFRLDTGFFDACTLAASALFCAQRLRCASGIALLPVTDNLRFGLGLSAGADRSYSPLIRAHRALWAKAIFRRDSALNRLRFGAVLPGEWLLCFR